MEGAQPLTQVGCCAYLRIYEPAAILGDSWWVIARPRSETLAAERRATLAAAIGASPKRKLAYLLVEDDLRFVCPVDLGERRALAYDEFVRPLAPIHAAALVPDESKPFVRPVSSEHVLTSPWSVPIRWYALFDHTERQLVLEQPDRSLIYRTTIVNARRRLSHVIPILQATISDTDAVSEALKLSSWLDGFHGMSRVELDYGGLVDVLEDAELRGDRGAQDVADSIEALQAGDGVTAGQAYLRVVTKWRRAASLVLSG